WLSAVALANPAVSVPHALPAKFAVRNALPMVDSATVDLVVRSRSGLAGVRPRAPGCSKNIPGAAATALQKSTVLLKPRCASTSCCAWENVAHSVVTGASNCALNASKVGMKAAALLGSSTSSNMAAGTRGVLVQSQ